ncbi:hypothetical protein ACIRL2_35650 [Embleya sp. NPDC127516]|uniref:hypothetical protein n=1 Tax=Embleya sp. NPDC127516 TaxID=3363990 RepID=UPI00382B3336
MSAFLMASSALFTVVAAPTAEAASQCQKNTRRFDIPWASDVSVTIQLCVNGTASSRRAVATVTWDRGDANGASPFEKFDVFVRLERNDVSKSTRHGDIDFKINGSDWGATAIASGAVVPQPRGGWTADGVVYYNINNDGEGQKTWSLTGSPKMN